MIRRRPVTAPASFAMLASASLLSACAAGDPASEGAMPAPRATATATPSVPGFPGKASLLVGDTSAEITATLGTPSLRRDEGTAEVWLYATPGGCRVHLVLYRDGAGADGRETVAHAAARLPPHTSEEACLREIAGARAHPPVT